ncbi:MAG: DUF2279 domain-containing protein [Bacteroidota bacterium]
MRKLLILLVVLLALFNTVGAQHADTTQHKWLTKKNIVIGAIVYQQVTGALVEYAWWWVDSLRTFHLEKDAFWNNYSLGMDKFGHFYISYLTFTAVNEAMRWAEFTPKQRLLTAVLVPTFWAISIEVGDAISPYGFSLPDLAANLSGVGYGFLQEKIPYFQNFNIKFGFWPTQVYRDQFPKKWAPTIDYNAHSYWLSVNVHKVLPKAWGKYWPELINLAVGYSIEDHYKPTMRRELLLGIDLNLRALKTRSPGWTALRNVANLVRIPSPGVKIPKGQEPTQYKWLLLH